MHIPRCTFLIYSNSAHNSPSIVLLSNTANWNDIWYICVVNSALESSLDIRKLIVSPLSIPLEARHGWQLLFSDWCDNIMSFNFCCNWFGISQQVLPALLNLSALISTFLEIIPVCVLTLSATPGMNRCFEHCDLISFWDLHVYHPFQ